MELPENSCAGALVLSARNPISIPYFTQSDYHSHVEGSPNGRVAIVSSYPRHVFYPAKNREFFLGSSVEILDQGALELSKNFCSREEEGVDLRDRISSTLLGVDYTPNLVCLEQRRPYGVVSVVSRSVETYFLGVYSKSADFLLWSNIKHFDQLLLQQNGLEDFWLHRFETRKDFAVVLPSKRLSSRWYRYSQTDSMKDPGRRFQALERSLFNGNTD